MTVYLDAIIFFMIWLAAQVVFHGFEAHVPLTKRLTKFAVIAVLLSVIHAFVGRGAYYAALGMMAVGIASLHGYYFHYRHGIHWRKAEPRDQYLELIGQMKSRKEKTY
ncbi:MAG: hypothetical protein KC519_00425 [Anaerolineae bacterium]|nr:hypothetical protein [Anaerolineae bacterium]